MLMLRFYLLSHDVKERLCLRAACALTVFLAVHIVTLACLGASGHARDVRVSIQEHSSGYCATYRMTSGLGGVCEVSASDGRIVCRATGLQPSMWAPGSAILLAREEWAQRWVLLDFRGEQVREEIITRAAGAEVVSFQEDGRAVCISMSPEDKAAMVVPLSDMFVMEYGAGGAHPDAQDNITAIRARLISYHGMDR